jgi:hypothetical protein
VFLCGVRASFVLCPRGLPHVMPFGGNKRGDGGATHFAAFHNVNCPNGFVYLWEDSLRIAHLNSSENFETGWSLRKVLLRQALLRYGSVSPRAIWKRCWALLEPHRSLDVCVYVWCVFYFSWDVLCR